MWFSVPQWFFAPSDNHTSNSEILWPIVKLRDDANT
jgi:hypothetical protein